MSQYMTGLDATFAAMDAHLATLETRVDEEIQAAGIECEAEAKQRAPVDTGRLRSSIHYVNVEKMQCRVGTNVNYALPVELGHVTRKRRTFVKARPFLFPAYLTAKRHLLEELKQL